ncbi:MAG: glycosyltransferase family 2 protein [Saprospiraceae bacterium]|nr:glycosyltransferase family 2 protein [Saprospiraceae bacterium]MCB9343653.1 glycosyltransferase family 2 protein [Lewinellaceae bacterium]
MEISVVVPLKNEEESLPELAAWIDRVCQNANLTYEIVMVDDGSNDTSWKIIEELHASNNRVRGIKFRRNYGKSAALHTAFQVVQGDVVITMDADLQDSPDEIPALYKMIKEEGYDLVSGWKKKRYDPISKTLPTKLFNAATRWMSGIQLHDFNCGLKAYRLDVVKAIEVYGEMHRYIPVIAKWAGFPRIGEKVVEHRSRKYGSTKYGGWDRFINGPLDLMSISFVGKFGKRPMHFFGMLGMLSFFIGFCILLYLSISKTLFQEYGIADRPLFYFGILALIIGSQLFLTGFIAELINRNSSIRNNYLIEKEI